MNEDVLQRNIFVYIYNILYRPTIVFTGNHFFLGG